VVTVRVLLLEEEEEEGDERFEYFVGDVVEVDSTPGDGIVFFVEGVVFTVLQKPYFAQALDV